MKKLLVTLAAVLVSVSTFAQGTIRFNNRISGTDPATTVNAPVTTPNGAGLGAQPGALAQLYLVSGGNFTALGTPTTFRTTSPAAMPFVTEPAEPVIVPGVAAGANATVVMRAWVGAASFDAATAANRGESNPITISLGGQPAGGGAPLFPALLVGLNGFVVPIPEPSVLALGLFGAAALLYRRRK